MRTYNSSESAVFFKTKDKYGGLSNMAAGYPVVVNNQVFLTNESLYQALKFPTDDVTQRLIQAAKSPVSAKIEATKKDNIRPDWYDVRVRAMSLCICLKLMCNYEKFSQLLFSTNNLHIVELSYKDTFWGANYIYGTNILRGENVLGRLLSKVRDLIKEGRNVKDLVNTLNIDSFLVFGKTIEL